MHKDLLVTKVTHFADGLRAGIYREAQKNTFEFPDVESDVIAAFLSWLYTGTLELVKGDTSEVFDVTIRLYEFADSIRLGTLQNQCLDHTMNLANKTDSTPEWAAVAAHYDTSMSNDKMRKLLVDLAASRLTSGRRLDIKAKLKDGLLNEELVMDLLSRINEVTSFGKVSRAVRDIAWYRVSEQSPKNQVSPFAS